MKERYMNMIIQYVVKLADTGEVWSGDYWGWQPPNQQWIPEYFDLEEYAMGFIQKQGEPLVPYVIEKIYRNEHGK